MSEIPFIFENAKEVGHAVLEAEKKYLDSNKTLFDHLRKGYPEYYNNVDSNMFVMTNVGYDRYSLKPNLARRGFLFRGETEYHHRSVANFYRNRTREERTFLNVKRDEFNLLFYSHPMVQLLRFGIKVDGQIYRFSVSPYALAQHYLFETSLIDLTSNLYVALFFATNSADKDGVHYHPYDGDEEFGYIYTYNLFPMFSFHADGLRTVGLQPFYRPGLQRGFVIETDEHYNLREDPKVHVYKFRHDKAYAKILNDMFLGGERLFPNDDLSIMTNIIRNRKNTVSEQAFKLNCRFNPHCNPRDIENDLLKHGVKIEDSCPVLFDKVSTAPYYSVVREQIWPNFCNAIYKPNEKDNARFIDKMLELAYDEEYEEFFEWDKFDLDKNRKRLSKQIDYHCDKPLSALDSMIL